MQSLSIGSEGPPVFETPEPELLPPPDVLEPVLPPKELELLTDELPEANTLGSIGWPGVQGTPSETSLDTFRMSPGTNPDLGHTSTGTRVGWFACICCHWASGTHG